MSMTARRFAAATCALGFAVPVYAGGWVEFANETATRMPLSLNDPALSTGDPEEKDYAWGDVDNDGDVDLVCVRKQPFTTTGKRPNVLFMNEGTAEGHALNGVLVDRTAQWASASDVGGDQGFLTPTNDRDVVLADVNNDGWLDIVTAPTLTDNQAKHLSHPRVYRNLGEIAGVWQGFRFENFRIPQMHATSGPRFCSVAAGDVTGDGYADLYFGDYDSGGAEAFDYNNKLLINKGATDPGVFVDQSDQRLTVQMRDSAFGAASVIADINDDGRNDVVKQTSLNDPTHVAVTYNSPTAYGEFDQGGAYDTIYELSPYFVSAGDLNQDGRLDLVITDDGTDRYLLNQGNGSDGLANFSSFAFPDSGGFGSQSVIADLNKDGHNDVIIADVDVDIPGCSRRTFIYRNLGNLPSVSFAEQGEVIPDPMLVGVHNVACFDLNGDTWLDLVIGRCSSTEVWMNVPPIGLVFTYPDGLPAFVHPGQTFEFDVQVSAFGGGVPQPGTGKVFISTGGGPFVESAMADLGGNLYRATLPAAACTEQILFFVSAQMNGGEVFTDPAGAPATWYNAVAAESLEITLRDDIEGDVSGWTVTNTALATGAWQQADPNGTIGGDGNLASPEDDATQGAANVKAFVTENGPPGGASGANDIDGGPTRLTSPLIDLSGTDATISYARWMYCDDESTADGDFLTVEVSNDNGASWLPVHSQKTGGTDSAWETVSFVVGDYVLPTATVRVRFNAVDNPNNSITEAGIDNFQVETYICETADPCPADLDDTGDVGFGDLLIALSTWGPCAGCPSDLDGDDQVGFNDLLLILSSWGPCP
jgi:hypothetical protein